jgi:rfaE bifunctional protein nucleotidyltransferase chain/domain
MLRNASQDLDLQLSGSYMIGDKRSDLQCARDGGLKGILVTTGYGWKEWELLIRDPTFSEPDMVAGSLLEAARRILAEENPALTFEGTEDSVPPPWTWKFSSREHLLERLEVHRARGETVVLANGVFDLLHAGHVAYLQAARLEGDILVVGVNDDTSSTALKGPLRPVFPAAERIAILSALSCVDYCVLFREPTAACLLEAVRPDIHAKGTDYTEETVPERETVKRVGGRVKIVGPDKIRSTSKILRTLSGRYDD